MIGAMPSLALDRGSAKQQQGSIGHLNRKNLSLHFRPPVLSSSQSNNVETGTVAPHCANKRLMFQLSVLAPLAGALLLFVGLVQLIPGADGEAFSLPLILIGSVILFLGLTIILFRLCQNYLTRYEIQGGPTTTTTNTTTTITTTAPQESEIKIEDVQR